MTAVTVKNLTKKFGRFIAVDNISFKINQGEIFGLLGPNGAGKTTTMRMLTGVFQPTSGQVLINGVDISNDPIPAQEQMGVVPEMANAYVDISAYKNLLLTAQLYGLNREQAKQETERWLKKVGLWKFKKRKVKKYSKGMKQRLILAMAMIHDPTLLFLDEPTSGLDVQSVRLIRSLIQESAKANKTIFLTTHNLQEANQLCDRIAILKQGQVVKIDSPQKLKKLAKKEIRVQVSFQKPVQGQLKLADTDIIKDISKEGDSWLITTAQQNEVIVHLVDFSRKNNNPIVTLNTKHPSLEQVFVQLTED